MKTAISLWSLISVMRTLTWHRGNWYNQASWTFGELKKLLFRSQCSVQKQGWGAVYLENHDQSRSLNKYFREKAAKSQDTELRFLQGSALASLLMGLRGTVFIYQGEELGMINCPFEHIGEYDDLNTKDQYKRALAAGIEEERALKFVNDRSRDNSRTPYPWSDARNAGFTEGKPWLKINPDYEMVNAEKQEADGKSLLHFYRNLIQLRKSPEYLDVLVYGEIRELEDVSESVIAFERVSENGKRVQIWVNMSDVTVKDKLPEGKVLVNNYGTENCKGGLRSYEACIIEI